MLMMIDDDEHADKCSFGFSFKSEAGTRCVHRLIRNENEVEKEAGVVSMEEKQPRCQQVGRNQGFGHANSKHT